MSKPVSCTAPLSTGGEVAVVRSIAVAAAFALLAVAAKADDDHALRVMTQNMDEGTDFVELSAARTPAEFLAAVTTTYNNILATKPAERAAAMAREIARHEPHLVAVQEASVLRTGTGGPATTVKSDLLQSLVDALAGLGQHYSVVAIVPGLDAQAPSTLGFDVRLTTQDAILARNEPDDLKLSNLQIQQFGIKLTGATPVGPITIARGWASIDVKRHGRSFRFVTTHLDAVSPPVELAQAMELVRSAGATTLPVIFAADFNSTADSSLDPSFPAYQGIINAGFADAWLIKRAPDPGFTCCQAPDLHNATSLLNHRIDLILFRGGFGVADIKLIGTTSADRTPSGLWPSDHAGVVATLRIPGSDQDDK
jgi:endonuclease/exonuclease/phosphatase family metal-dependent hydrolase